MSYFSDELQKLFRERDVKIYLLSSVSGIDRTLIHKMLNGTRIPSSSATVIKIASVLLLTPEETEKLMNSYRITKMGVDNYYRRKTIEDFFDIFNDISQRSSVCVEQNYEHGIKTLFKDSAVYGSLEVNNLIKTAIEIEASKDDGVIRIIAQPEYSFLFECLALTGRNHNNLLINHTVCLENSLKGDKSLYNINYLRTIMPIILSGCRYHPMCYYDTVSSHISSTSIMPYLILTHEYVIQVSYHQTYATISDSREYNELYTKLFKEMEEKSTDLLTVSYGEQYNTLAKLISQSGVKQYVFSYVPDLVPFLTKEMLSQLVRSGFTDLGEELLKRKGLFEKDGAETAYFTKEGLERFIHSGILTLADQPPFLPMDTDDRHRVIQLIFDAVQKETYRPIIVQPTLFHMPDYLALFTFQDVVIFVFTPSGKQFRFCVLEEKSLVFAFRDFFKYLPESGITLSQEETIEVLKNMIKTDNQGEL